MSHELKSRLEIIKLLPTVRSRPDVLQPLSAPWCLLGAGCREGVEGPLTDMSGPPSALAVTPAAGDSACLKDPLQLLHSSALACQQCNGCNL